MSIEFYLKHS